MEQKQRRPSAGQYVRMRCKLRKAPFKGGQS